MNTYAVSIRVSGESIDVTVRANNPMTAVIRAVRMYVTSEDLTQLLVQCKKIDEAQQSD